MVCCEKHRRAHYRGLATGNRNPAIALGSGLDFRPWWKVQQYLDLKICVSRQVLDLGLKLEPSPLDGYLG